MTRLSQMTSVSLLNLRTLGKRRGASLSAVFGIAGVVLVFVAVLSIATGFRAVMVGAGSPDVVIVLRSDSDSELTSSLSREEVRIVGEAPGVKRDGSGPMSSPELFVIVDLPKRSTGSTANVPLRGVGPAAFKVRESLEILEGRTFQPGTHEVIVGRGAAHSFKGLDLGSEIKLGQISWKVTGIFASGGTVPESEIWTDSRVLQPVYRRGDRFQSVLVKLDQPESFDRFEQALGKNPNLNVKAVRERDFYAEQAQATVSLISTLGTLVAVLMGVGALFGALNTMYNAVATRSREIATLRALGFSGWVVVTSVMVESLVLALVGGAAGSALAYLGFDGYRTSTLSFRSFSQVAFAFDVTPELLIQGTIYALVLGFLGGLLPALRAARLPVASALREL